jgi:hypothetical protein
LAVKLGDEDTVQQPDAQSVLKLQPHAQALPKQ